MRWIERHRYFLDFTLSALMRRKAKNISLVLVFALVVFLLNAVLLFTEAIRGEAERVLAGAPEMIVQRNLAGRHELIPLAYIEKIRSIRGVRNVEARLWGYYYHPASRANYTVMATELFDLQEDQIIIGEGVRRTWQGTQDSMLFFKAYTGEPVALRIRDEFSADTALVSSDLILVSTPAFRRIFGIAEGFATDITARIRNLAECPTIAEKVVERLPDTRPVLREEIARTYGSLFDWRGGYVVVLLSAAIISFLIFAWDKATGLTAEEKSEIGILKALGWDTADVLLLKFWEGLTICLTAFVLGTAAAYAYVFWADGSPFEHALKGWAILYPSFELTPVFNAYQLSAVFGLSVGPYLLITLVPAWRAASTDPDTVMR
ncbi:MAG: FtsX-like permease family protein [Desulfobacteraceae bacterium]|nr:MAG: FtsX-like permease family protein [Desulfobacteraceae bacterium]